MVHKRRVRDGVNSGRPTVSSLKCGLVNIQSVGNKTLLIRDLLCEENFDVFAVTETWLNSFDTAKINEMTPPTHTFLHVPRHGRVGGGVGLFVSNALSHVRLMDRIEVNSFEYMMVSFKCSNKWIKLIVLYRPPSSDINMFFEEFSILIEQVDMVSFNLFCVGDFNIWMEDHNNYVRNKFCDLLESYQLCNFVNVVTSSTGHMLDLVLGDLTTNLVGNVVVDNVCTISPVHRVITFNLQMAKDSFRKKICFRRKTAFNSNDFIKDVLQKFTDRLSDTCVHNSSLKRECVDCLMDLYNDISKSEYNIRCPYTEKYITVKDNSPWFDGDILNMKRERKRKECKWRRLKTAAAEEDYKLCKNRLNYCIRVRKAQYYRQKIGEAGTDLNKIYKLLNDLSGCSKKKKLPDGWSEDVLANQFLVFFREKIVNIVSGFSDVSLPTSVEWSGDKLSHFKTINYDVLEKIVTKITKTCLADPFPFNELVGAENFSDFLNIILSVVNTCILSSTFPESEKVAIVKPILKGALDHQELSSYRPVSNLSFMSKIIEYVILDQLAEHLDKVNAIPDCQSAYRKLYSTETAVCSVVNDLLEIVDEGKCAIVVLLDLSAAFDTVVHEILLYDLESVGVVDAALLLLSNYLSDRKFTVQVGNSFSKYEHLRRGVPQGSILGPVLFNLYTSSLSRIMERYGVRVKLYADDTQFYFTIYNIEDTSVVLNNILLSVGEWMCRKQLKLNEAKTEYMIIGSKAKIKNLGDFNLVVHDNIVNIAQRVRDLGVLIDSNLSFNDQVKNVVKTTSFSLRNISFIKKYIDVESLKKLVISGVISRLDYCNSIYCNLPNCKLKRLQIIMNRAARLIKGTSRHDRITPVLIELHWLPIKARIKYKICVMTHKILQTGKPGYLRDLLIVINPEEDGVSTRRAASGQSLFEPRVASSIGFRSFKSASPRMYNSIPLDLRQIVNTQNFKDKLKTFLFTDCYDMADLTIKEEYRL